MLFEKGYKLHIFVNGIFIHLIRFGKIFVFFKKLLGSWIGDILFVIGSLSQNFSLIGFFRELIILIKELKKKKYYKETCIGIHIVVHIAVI